jgi:ribonuclease J
LETFDGAPTAPAVDIVPLGGLGEFGMNMMLLVCGDTAVIVDAGVMFPGPELFGVDLVIPDFSVLAPYRGRIAGLVLTHGHEDHIGAIAHVLPHIDGKVYGSRMTLALIEPKLQEHGIEAGDRLVAVAPKDRVTVGSFEIEFLRVTHSMTDCLALAVHTPAGTIVLAFLGDQTL